jgi:uncharacterized protein
VRDLPAQAAWRHVGASDGFEVLFPQSDGDGLRLVGSSAAVEEGDAWGIRYEIAVASDWTTRSARVTSLTRGGDAEVLLEADGAGAWRIDGRAAPELDGLLDVDLEGSVCTNLLPVHRLALAVDERAVASAAYVRARDLSVERLDQTYRRITDADDGGQRYDYASPRFNYEAVLVYAPDGLIRDYPELAERFV